MRQLILTIGRHKAYPYVALLLVTAAYIYTDPMETFNLRYAASFFGAFMGILCVIFLAKGKNLGNFWGVLAAFGESSGNYLGGNVGAALPSIYYFFTHIYGLISWRNKQDQTQTVKTRTLKEIHFFYILGFMLIATFINIFLTHYLAVENDPYQLMANCFIFGLAVTAQLLMVLRYSFHWLVWVFVHILVVILNIYTNNPVIVAQYAFFLFNAVYGYFEWKNQEEGVNTATNVVNN